jgi:hypothetical protein
MYAPPGRDRFVVTPSVGSVVAISLFLSRRHFSGYLHHTISTKRRPTAQFPSVPSRTIVFISPWRERPRLRAACAVRAGPRQGPLDKSPLELLAQIHRVRAQTALIPAAPQAARRINVAEGALAPRTQVVHCPRGKLFPHAALPFDQPVVGNSLWTCRPIIWGQAGGEKWRDRSCL